MADTKLVNIETRQVSHAFNKLKDELGASAVVARILDSRGIESARQLDLRLSNLYPPAGLPDIELASDRVVQAIEANESILIAGDYDVDGATSAALCVSFLHRVGHENVRFKVPNRMTDGYGLSVPFMQTLLDLEPNLVITVDNGVSSLDGIALANKHGIDVVVTDHHIAPATLPEAKAIVNPNLPTSNFKCQLAGVGVAFYLMGVVLSKLKKKGHFQRSELEAISMVEWLDLVAVGTIADLVPLDFNNRVLVHEGLKRIRLGRARMGLVALCEVAKVKLDTLTSENVGFQIAPRINAAGRLDDISVGIQTLLANAKGEARELAVKLDKINRDRRFIQEDMDFRADSINRVDTTQSEHSRCIYDETFHEGIVGLVASRIVRSTGLPSVVFADADSEKMPLLKGSARSVVGVHIRDVFADIHTEYPNLLLQFGGHAMAAGLTIKRANFDRFRVLFDQSVVKRAAEDAFDAAVKTDGELTPEELSLDTVSELESYGPWGQEFPSPIFHGRFEVVHKGKFSDDRHVRLTLKNGDGYVQAVAFSQQPVDGDHIFIVYQISRNVYRGSETLQLIVQHMETA